MSGVTRAQQLGDVLVPRYARLLCDIAATAGVTVANSFTVCEGSDTHLACISTTWRGSAADFERTALFSPAQLVFLKYPIGLKRAMNVPADANGMTNPLLMGDMLRCEHGFEYQLWLLGIPRRITQIGAVERVDMDEETAWHGTAAALESIGISTKRLPTKKHRVKNHLRRHYHVGDEEVCWSARRLPDESYLYRQELPSLHAARLREEREQKRAFDELVAGRNRTNTSAKPRPPLLRLVVDNR